jgi:hypothetical protein
MNELEIIDSVYMALVANRSKSGIPIHLRTRSVVGTVQDDPFDTWVSAEIKHALKDKVEVFHSGTLTTPDLVIRDKSSGALVGLEIKTLIQKANGTDPRGLTMDYNSSLPCGSAMIKQGKDTVIIPCFYLFALLDSSSRYIVTLIVADGDLLNYDIQLYKESKYANFTEYGHGPYAEGSVRHRRMYTYPNPLNSRIAELHMRMILIAKKVDFGRLQRGSGIVAEIVRTDRHGNDFIYALKDVTRSSDEIGQELITIRDIFKHCKKRQPKERTAAMPNIPSAK